MELLKVENIRKSFGAIKALQGVNLSVEAGEVHALIGENGAGKSTLMKILSGAEKPDEGSISFQGKGYKPANPAQGRLSGIAMIYQELTLALHLNVEENITLGIEESNLGFVKSKAEKVKEVLSLLGQSDIDLKAKTGTLSIARQQLLEIARALMLDAKIVIMDEPTSSLTAEDTKALFNVIKKLKNSGIAVIYISHFLEEVQSISDRFTVLRDGQTVGTGNMKEATVARLIELMVGRSLNDIYPKISHKIGETVLTVNRLSGTSIPKNACFKLRKGEILGISGLVGAGRTEMIRCLFGLDKVTNGEVHIAGMPDLKAQYLNPVRALESGMDFLSENRKEEGLATSMTIGKNITLSALNRISKWGFINGREEDSVSQKWTEIMNVKCRDHNQAVGALSGGNQQKVSIARLLNYDNDILFLDEPTRGIDVGSKAEIYRLIQDLAANGKSVVVISSYLPELIGVCDTLAVMHRGELSPVKPVPEWNEHSVMLFATSGVME